MDSCLLPIDLFGKEAAGSYVQQDLLLDVEMEATIPAYYVAYILTLLEGMSVHGTRFYVSCLLDNNAVQ